MENSLIDFPANSDERGSLIALEQFKNIPFEIKRVYYLFGTKHDKARGFHAHADLEQVLICVSGSCKVRVDNGKKKTEYELNKPNQGLFIGKYIWREMFEFSADCILLVLANNYFDENDYIRRYEDFQLEVSKFYTK